MKKKWVVFVTLLCCGVFVVGCGGNNSTNEKPANKQSQKEEKVQDENKKYPVKYPDQAAVGEAEVYLVGDAGDTKSGEALWVLYRKDIILGAIGLNAWGFDGTKPATIYIDGEEYRKVQLSDSQITLQLKESMNNKGIHNVELVQLDDGGNIVFYKLMNYHIK